MPALAALLAFLTLGSAKAQANTTAVHQSLSTSLARNGDSTSHSTPQDYWRNLAARPATSNLAHEAGHVAASLSGRARPGVLNS